MLRISFFTLILAFNLSSCNEKQAISNNKETEMSSDTLAEVQEGVQVISLLGDTLYSRSLYASTVSTLLLKKELYERDPENIDNLIWYGRWTAYSGDFRKAIKIYSEGIKKSPLDARLYRHRGHRYISVRAFDLAIADLQKAAKMINGNTDEIEPDGQPNALNIPTSTLQTNIWYHLGLAHYLQHDYNAAKTAYEQGIEASTTDDMLVAFLHWYYMTLSMLGLNDEAKDAVATIPEKQSIIENLAYYNMCLLYNGTLKLEELQSEEFSDIMNEAAKYGIANWHYYNGDELTGKSLLQGIKNGDSWASVGYIAAEADLKFSSLDSNKQ